MAESTGYILAAAGLVIVNETVLRPTVEGKPLFQDFPWRVIPAAAIGSLVIAGVETLSPAFGKGLGILVLLAVVLGTASSASSPLDNITKMVGLK